MTNEEWIAEVKRLDTFFKETPILIKEYKNSYMVISDIPKFIDSHLASAKANTGNPWFKQGITRLQELELAIRNQTKIVHNKSKSAEQPSSQTTTALISGDLSDGEIHNIIDL